MSCLRIIAFFLVCWALPGRAAGSGPLDHFPALMDTLVGGYYGAADSLCGRLEAEFGGQPATLYARATVRYAHMIDLEDTVGRAEFIALVDSCAELAGLWKETHPERLAELAYLRGSALSCKGLLLAHERRLLSALHLLISARGEFDEAIAADSLFFDAYLGRGAYRYAVASRAKSLTWLPLIPSREDGWNDLWLAVKKSRFSTFAALTSLAWFALDDRNFVLADSICRVGLNRFPKARSYLWPKLALEFRQSRWESALQVARELLNQYLLLPENNGYETIGLYLQMSVCADSLNRPGEARAYADSGLATFRTPEVAERRAGKFAELRARACRETK